jgi:8-oxo-dGTP pyrophosphatase MutT (NUDIX family)/tetratricopeptide (TPR) repeat protein
MGKNNENVISELVIRTYPYPIALAYRMLYDLELKSEQRAEIFSCMLNTFESLIHFLATVAVSAYIRSGATSEEYNRLLLEKFIKGKWSVGDIYSLLRDTIKRAGDCRGLLPYGELPSYLFDKSGNQSDSGKVLESFIKLRNDLVHGRGRKKLYEELEPNLKRLDEELSLLGWLNSWQLIRPTIIDQSVVKKVDLLMGDLRKKGQDYELRLEERDLDYMEGAVQQDKSMLLVSPEGDRYLPLFPLSLFSQGVYFLQQCDWGSLAAGRKLKKAAYVSYEPSLSGQEERSGDLAVRLLERHVGHLGANLKPEADQDFVLPEVRHEQEKHLRSFAGREETLRLISEWIDEKTEGGYLLVLGPRGQGKSALAAKLAHREQERGGCLLHMIRSHANPLKFLPSLISQAARASGARFGVEAYRGDVDDLRNSLVRGIELVINKTGRALIVLDALDELDSTWKQAAFLPASLPKGARVIITCRPQNRLVRSLRTRLRGLEVLNLPPLSDVDLDSFLKQRLKGLGERALEGILDKQSLLERSQGNPLFLRRALDYIFENLEKARATGSRPQIDLESLPATLDDLFEDIYNEIAEKKIHESATEQGRHKARLLKMLCVAREPLGIEQLSELTSADQAELTLEECNDFVSQISQYLLDVGGGQFKPWHQGLVDYVKKHVLGKEGQRKIEDLFCRWLASPARSSGQHALRHRADYLQAAGRLDDFIALLSDAEFVKARCDADMIFEMVADLATASHSRPKLEGVAAALVKAFEEKRPEFDRQQLRSALNQSFGVYPKWPEPLRSALEESDNFNVMYFLAEAHDKENDNLKAERVLRKMLETLNPEDRANYTVACVKLADVLDHADRPADALQILEEFISLTDAEKLYGRGYVWANYHKGICLRRVKRYDEARAVLERLHKAGDGGIAIASLHQLAIIDIEQGNFAEAEKKLMVCKSERDKDEFNHRRAYEYRRLGQVYALTERRDEARAAFDEALAISARCADWRYVKEVRSDIARFLVAPYLKEELPERVSLPDLAARFHVEQSHLAEAFRLLADERRGYLEIIDEETGMVTGQAARWDVIHSEGCWHASVTVIVVDERGILGLQLRGESDSRGRWDASVTGHQDVGESDLVAAVREMREELGVVAEPERLVRVGDPYEFCKRGEPTITRDHHENPTSYLYRTGKMNRERVSVFIVKISEEEKAKIKTGQAAALEVRWESATEAAREAQAVPDRFASGFKSLFGSDEAFRRIKQAIEKV